MPLAAGVLLKNRYRISRFLAQGASGAVYQAWDTQEKRNCAIKEHTDTTVGRRQHFERLAAQLKTLNHPGLPKVWDSFLQPGSGLYLVMEYIDGQDLRHMLLAQSGIAQSGIAQSGTNQAQDGRLPESQVLGWMIEVCDALAYLHQQMPSIYHMDIKPENIRVTSAGKAVLVDLGTLREPGGALHGVTAQYVAPETIEQGWDEQSDVYALGITLYTLLTGVIPAKTDRQQAGFARLAGISPRVSLLIERAVRSDPATRLENIAEFRRILLEATTEGTEHLSKAEVPAIPPTPVLEDQRRYRTPLEAAHASATTWKRIFWPLLLLGASVLLVLFGFWVNGAFSGGKPTSQVVQASATPAAQVTTPTIQPADASRTSPTFPATESSTNTPALSQSRLTATQPVATLSVAKTQEATQVEATQTPTPEPTPLTAVEGFYVFRGHETSVLSIAYSPNDKVLASGSADGQIILWDVLTGAMIHSLSGHSDSVNALAFSPDSSTLASGSGDKTAIQWNTENGEIIRILAEHREAISDVVFSPDGSVLVCTSQDSKATVWNAQSGELLKTLVASVSKDLVAGFASATFSPDGSTLAIGTAKGVVLWDASLWNERRIIAGNVLSLAYAPDGQSLASGLMTGGVALWNLRSYRLIFTFQKHIRPVTDVVFSPDGKILASSSRDGTIILWDVAQQSILRILDKHSDAVTDLAFSSDGRFLVSASVDGTVILWDISR